MPPNSKTQATPFPWLATFVGLPLLGLWIATCAAAFIYILNSLGATEGVLQWTTWPLVLVMLGMPVIVGLMFGGGRLLRQVLELKAFIDDLPEVLKRVEGLSDTISRASKSLQESAAAVDDAAGQVASASAPAANKESVDLFWEHYERAKETFAMALTAAKRWEDFPRYLQSDKDAALAALQKSRHLSEAAARYINRAIEIERNTRRTRRSNLTREQVEELDKLQNSLS